MANLLEQLSVNTGRLIAVVEHAKGKVGQQHAKRKVDQQHAKGKSGAAACKGKGGAAACKGRRGAACKGAKVEQQHAEGKSETAACKGKGGAAHKGQKGTALTCSSLGNGSKGYEQDQQLRAGKVQQAGRAPPGEEERRQDSHVNDQHCC